VNKALLHFSGGFVAVATAVKNSFLMIGQVIGATTTSSTMMDESFTSIVMDDLDYLYFDCEDDATNSRCADSLQRPNATRNEQLEIPLESGIIHDSLSVIPDASFVAKEALKSNENPLSLSFSNKPIPPMCTRTPVVRSKSCDCVPFPRYTETQREIQKSPPNTIVFITTSQRQKRRSSLCSQLTLDDEIDVSNDDNVDEDVTNVSLDVRDVFTEQKIEYKKFRKNNDSASNYSSSTSSRTSYDNDSVLEKKIKLLLHAETERSTAPVRQLPSKQRSTRTTISKLSNNSKLSNSAKLRWLHRGENHSCSGSNDDTSASEYEDFAQDSLLGATRTQRIVQKLAVMKTLEDNDLDEENNNCTLTKGHHEIPPPRLKSTCIGRAA
jgi:hypothetical protein